MHPDTSLQFDPIFGSVLLILCLAVLLISLLVLSRSFGTIPSRRNKTLVALRMIVILLVILALVRPAWVTTTARREPGTLVILLDGSRSMQVTDAAAGRSRWQSASDALRSCLPELQKLRENFDVNVFVFDRQSRVVQSADGVLELGDKPQGDQSDIALALVETIQRELGKRSVHCPRLNERSRRA